VLTSRSLTTLVMVSLLLMLVYLLVSILDRTRARILIRASVRFDHALGARLLAATHRIGIEQNGGSGKQLLSDLANIRQFLAGQGAFGALDAPWIPIYFVIILLMHPSLAWAALIGGGALVTLAIATELLTAKPLARANERASEASRFVGANLRNREVIEAMGMLKEMTRRWQARQDEHLYEQATASERAAAIGAVSRFIRMSLQSLILGYGAYLVIAAEVTPGVMIAASILTGRMLSPIEQLIGSWRQWGSALDAWKRVNQMLSLPGRPPAGITLPAPMGSLRLEGVSGGPPHLQANTITNISVQIPFGASVAIIGASASGKSTLLRLIAGVWPARAGIVRLDEADIRQWERAELGPHIGYLPQDVELLEGTIAENIARHGTPDDEKILAAARAAGVHEMILQLPQGYATQVGASGAYLSGGQRQRIALARALYGTPKLLILDEPDANLDEAGEQALERAILDAKKNGQTTIIVSHRPLPVRHCEFILLMQAGRAAAFGARDQVLAALTRARAGAGAAPNGTSKHGNGRP
jgi:ATP-binding cassette subfamily C exporter for protease/lipase